MRKIIEKNSIGHSPQPAPRSTMVEGPSKKQKLRSHRVRFFSLHQVPRDKDNKTTYVSNLKKRCKSSEETIETLESRNSQLLAQNIHTDILTILYMLHELITMLHLSEDERETRSIILLKIQKRFLMVWEAKETFIC